MRAVAAAEMRFHPALSEATLERGFEDRHWSIVKYSDTQLRVPAGSPEGGRWTRPGSADPEPPRPSGLDYDEHRVLTDWVTSYNRMHAMQADPQSESSRTFARALAKCPVMSGPVLRGIQMPAAEGVNESATASVKEAKAYFDKHVGGTLTFRQPVSVSPVGEVAAAYAEPVLLRISPAEGAVHDISWKVADLGAPGFNEGIIAPGKFRVDSVTTERVRDSFYDTKTREVVAVNITDITKGPRVWAGTTLAKVAATGHRLAGSLDDFALRPALHLAAGGAARTASLDPIVARVRAELVALAAEQGNRPDVAKYDESQPRDDHGRWTSGGAEEAIASWPDRDYDMRRSLAAGKPRADALLVVQAIRDAKPDAPTLYRATDRTRDYPVGGEVRLGVGSWASREVGAALYGERMLELRPGARAVPVPSGLGLPGPADEWDTAGTFRVESVVGGRVVLTQTGTLAAPDMVGLAAMPGLTKYSADQPRDERGRWAVMMGREGSDATFELTRTRDRADAEARLSGFVSSQANHWEGHSGPGGRVVVGPAGDGRTGVGVVGDGADFTDLFWVEPVTPESLTKYSDDQPRDDHGRWTSGGGATPVDLGDRTVYRQTDGTLTRWPTLDAAIKDYEGLHPGTKVYVDRPMTLENGTPLPWAPGTLPVETMAALGQLDKLQNQFPGVHIATVAVVEGLTAQQMGTRRLAQFRPGEYGGPGSIELNPLYWNAEPGYPPAMSLYAPSNGYHPAGTDNPSGIMTHEFGHAVDDVLHTASKGADLTGGWDSLTTSQQVARNDIFPSIQNDVTKPASGYGKTSSGENFAEWFASAYAAGNPDAEPFRAQIDRVMPILTSPDPVAAARRLVAASDSVARDGYVTRRGETYDATGPVYKYSDAQPRVPAGSPEGGEWTGGADPFGGRNHLATARVPIIRTSPAVIASHDWPTTKPWQASASDIAAGKFPELRLADLGEGTGNDVMAAVHGIDQPIVINSRTWDDLPVDRRVGLLYHELGHIVTASALADETANPALMGSRSTFDRSAWGSLASSIDPTGEELANLYAGHATSEPRMDYDLVYNEQTHQDDPTVFPEKADAAERALVAAEAAFVGAPVGPQVVLFGPNKTVLKYSEAEPRDERGRWTAAGGEVADPSTSGVTPGGFSIHPYRGSSPTTGYQVAMSGRTTHLPASILDPDQSEALTDALVAHREANRDVYSAGGSMYIGGWVEGGQLWLEPSQRVSSRADAVRLGIERNQIAVWDNARHEEVPTGGTGKVAKAAGTEEGRDAAVPGGLGQPDAGAEARGRPRDGRRVAQGAAPGLTKSVDDEPRVPAGSSEGGEWTSGGGGDPGTGTWQERIAAMNAAMAADRGPDVGLNGVGAVFPKAYIRLEPHTDPLTFNTVDGMSKEMADRVTKQLVTLGQTWGPKVTGLVKGIVVQDLGPTGWGTVGGKVAQWQPLTGDLVFNTRWWDDTSRAIGMAAFAEAQGWAPKGCTTVESAVTHEFGHILDDATGGKMFGIGTRYDNAANPDPWKPVSGYAGGGDAHEAAAELFRAYTHQPKDEWDAGTQEMGKYLNRAKASLNKP